jgi:hypothetical protein
MRTEKQTIPPCQNGFRFIQFGSIPPMPEEFRRPWICDIDNGKRPTFTWHERQVALQLDIVRTIEGLLMYKDGGNGESWRLTRVAVDA